MLAMLRVHGVISGCHKKSCSALPSIYLLTTVRPNDTSDGLRMAWSNLLYECVCCWLLSSSISFAEDLLSSLDMYVFVMLLCDPLLPMIPQNYASFRVVYTTAVFFGVRMKGWAGSLSPVLPSSSFVLSSPFFSCRLPNHSTPPRDPLWGTTVLGTQRDWCQWPKHPWL